MAMNTQALMVTPSTPTIPPNYAPAMYEKIHGESKDREELPTSSSTSTLRAGLFRGM